MGDDQVGQWKLAGRNLVEMGRSPHVVLAGQGAGDREWAADGGGEGVIWIGGLVKCGGGLGNWNWVGGGAGKRWVGGRTGG